MDGVPVMTKPRTTTDRHPGRAAFIETMRPEQEPRHRVDYRARREEFPASCNQAGGDSAGGRHFSPRPNQVTYSVGRKIKVRTVAASNPPMIAKAIGPQNTVGAIGIIPRTVDMAVNMIGRNRELLASTAASQGVLPKA